MISISKPRFETQDDRSRIIADITIDGNRHVLWYQVPQRYERGLCVDRGDAFVAGLLYFAMKYGHDITSEAPLTGELKDGIEQDFLGVVCEYLPGEKPYHVKITSEVCAPILKERQVCATGISCGVDSLQSVKTRLVDSKLAQRGDRYLVINQMHGALRDESSENHAALWERLRNQAEAFSDEAGIPLIVGETNYNAGAIPGLSFELAPSFGNLFCILSMQNLYTDYYLASGGPLDSFADGIRGGIYSVDPDDYDVLTLSAMSTRSLKLVSTGLTRRAEKLRMIQDWDLAQKHLDVCHVHAVDSTINGTYDCPKCMHTVVELMSIGALDKFDRVFDVSYVKAHRSEYLAELMRRRLRGVQTAKEVWPYRRQMGFVWSDYLPASVIVIRKLLQKVMRRNRTSFVFSSRG